MKILKDLIFEQLSKDRTILKELYEPYSKNEVAQLATALERMRWNRANKPGLVAIQWNKNERWNETGKKTEVVVDFFVKDNLMKEFTWNERIGEIDLLEEVPNRMSLDKIDYHHGLALAIYNIREKPLTGSTLALTALLSAEVPKGHVEKYEPIAKIFLRAFFRRSIETRERMFGRWPQVPVEATGREMTVPEMKQVIRDCFIFNRLSLAQELHSAYEELKVYREVDDSFPLAMACIALEDENGADLPLFVLDECGCGNDYLRNLRRMLEDDHVVMLLEDLDQFVERMIRCFAEDWSVLLIGNFQELARSEHKEYIERSLAELIKRGRKIVLVSSVGLDEIGMDGQLQEQIEQGLTISLE